MHLTRHINATHTHTYTHRNFSALLRMVFGDVAPRLIYSVLTRNSSNTLNTLQSGEPQLACFGCCRNKLLYHSMAELKRYHSVLSFAHDCARQHSGHVIKSYQAIIWWLDACGWMLLF